MLSVRDYVITHRSQVLSVYQKNGAIIYCEVKGSRLLKDPDYKDLLCVDVLKATEDGTVLICDFGPDEAPADIAEKKKSDGKVLASLVAPMAVMAGAVDGKKVY